MANLDELYNERLSKIKDIDAYPAEVKRDVTASEFLDSFDKNLESRKEFFLSGRVVSLRGQGKLIFFDIFDGTVKLQVIAKSEETSDEQLEYITNHVDIGDFVEIYGGAFLTLKGHKSLILKSIRLISKALRPMPDKWHGLKDEEQKVRLRYLDILQDDELRDLFYKKAKFWQVARSFFNEKGFLEVETPTIELTTGGAEANPFKTFHNDYDIDVFMRISVGELWQKRLMAAGFPKTFEIGRVYRNEGSSPDHLQEFTNLEFYMAYADYKVGMQLVKELYIKIANEVFGATKFESRGHTFDLVDEWKIIDYKDEIKSQTGIDIFSDSDESIKNKLKDLKVRYEGENRERLVDTLWKYCRKNISGPAFLINNPILVSPLAKKNNDGLTAQVFQPIIAGTEVGKGYSELNDPIDQRNRFEQQKKLLEAGDNEAMMPDYDFLEMLEHGMPPTCGFGFGERLFAILANKTARECQLFPLVKPKMDK